ncbi:MAG: helix-turn-helix domain-containing protein [Psychrobium sp.]|nr:helix-turn-helix domain-containing protein [Psychrobium sp.]
MTNFKNTDFKKLATKQKSIQMKIRLLALSYFQDEKPRTSIAKYLKVSRTSVNKWVSSYLTGGIDALSEKPSTGRPHFLTRSQQTMLCDFID